MTLQPTTLGSIMQMHKHGVHSGIRPGLHGPHLYPDGAYNEAAQTPLYRDLGGFAIMYARSTMTYYHIAVQSMAMLALAGDRIHAAYVYDKGKNRFTEVVA